MTDPPMYNVANAVFHRSLAIVRSLPLPGCVFAKDKLICFQDKRVVISIK